MPTELSSIMSLEVPLIVRLAERPISLQEVLKLTPGAILELPKDSEEELDVMVNNRQIGNGLAVKIGENFGIRITSIKSTGQVVQALGSSGSAGSGNSGGAIEDDDQDFDAIAAQMLQGQI